jgi:hypothetical protein
MAGQPISSQNPSVDALVEQCGKWAEEEGRPLSFSGLSEEQLADIEARNIQTHYPPSMDKHFDYLEGYEPDSVGDALRSCYSLAFRGVIH